MTKKEELITEVTRATKEELAEIFEGIKGSSSRDKAQDFIQYIHPTVKSSLSKEELASLTLDLSVDKLCFKKQIKDSGEQKVLAEKILGPNFKKVRGDNQDDYFCKVINSEHQILKPLTRGGAESEMEDNIAQYITENHTTIPTNLVTEIRKQFVKHAIPIKKPKPTCRHDEMAWCFHKPLFELKEMSIPTWHRILDRMSDPDVFAAWIYGVYSGEYQGRRVLWLHGPNGEDGKSLIAKTLSFQLFGDAAGAINNSTFQGDGRFVTSYFENARLVVYPDANNTKILKSELFKTIASSGADPVLIERKGQQAYTAELSARLWVSSNYAPEITDENFILSRIQYIFIKAHNEAPDPKINQGLVEEMPGFLYYAKQCWNDLNVEKYDITTNAETKKLVGEIVRSSCEEFDQIFANLFVQTSNVKGGISGTEMKQLLGPEGLNSSNEQKVFHDWLIKVKGVNKIKLPPANTVVYTNLRRVGHAIKVACGDKEKLDFTKV